MDKAGLVASCQSQETGPTPGGRPAVGVGAAAGPPQPVGLTVVVYQIGTLRQAKGITWAFEIVYLRDGIRKCIFANLGQSFI